ncbi:MAG: lactate dehydrogenase [Desulfobulbus sp.]
MDVSIVGASGGCGREIVTQIVQQRLLESREILQLVGSNPNSRRPHLLHGFRADLQDAYAEIIPELNVTDDPDKIIGDVVVITGGQTFTTTPAEIGSASRDSLARANVAVFERFACALAQNRNGFPPVVIIVTNPVELGVAIFSQYLPRTHVIGMGAYSDSARFRWEIASDLGIRRQRVRGYMLGEHGNGMVPIWSSVRVQGMTDREWRLLEPQLRRGLRTEQYAEALVTHQKRMIEMISDDHVNGALRALHYVRDLPPDLRVPLKPFAIHYTDAKTQTATAAATVELVKAVLEGHRLEVSAQYMHQGENGLYGPCGGRLLLAGNVLQVMPDRDSMTPTEHRLVAQSARDIATKIDQWWQPPNKPNKEDQ